MRLILVFPKKFEFYKLLRVLTFDPDFDLVDMVQIDLFVEKVVEYLPGPPA